MVKGTKTAIKARYIELLRETYPAIYVDGSRPLDMAGQVSDNALAGKIRLEGDCWFAALRENGIPKSATKKTLANLPE